MAKIKYTKNELKKQKDMLKRFNRYLPTLKLKKQQLQMEIGKIVRQIENHNNVINEIIDDVSKWVDVLAEDVDLTGIVTLKNIITDEGNIAGIDIPIFKNAEFEVLEYDLMEYPLWVDTVIDYVKKVLSAKAELQILKKQEEILQEELRITVQRVNLFEKVKIPESKNNIRTINIFLGDQQTAEVVRGKIAKNKIEKKKERAAS